MKNINKNRYFENDNYIPALKLIFRVVPFLQRANSSIHFELNAVFDNLFPAIRNSTILTME